MKKSPIQKVKDQFGSKEKLVDELVGILEPDEGESKEEFAARLKLVANSKLLHLHELGAKVSELGGRDSLAAKVAELEGQAKDEDYVEKLKGFTMGRLLDMYQSASRRQARSSK